MKRLTLLLVLTLSVALCGSCVTESSGESFDPTRIGYALFVPVNATLQREMNDVWQLFALAHYASADTDAERERLHDAYFYTLRIVHTPTQWRLISKTSELVIDTNGKNLFDEGAIWSYYYRNRNYYTTELPTITRQSRGEYTLNLPPTPKRTYYSAGLLSLSVTYWSKPSSDTIGIQILLGGEGHTQADDRQIDFAISEPLQYSTDSSAFDEGLINLSTATDRAEARYLLARGVTIGYNGRFNDYDIKNYYGSIICY